MKGSFEVEYTMVRDRVTTAVASGVILDDEGEGEARYFEGFGSSVCDREDTPDARLGYQFAVGRALKELGQSMTRDAWATVRERNSSFQQDDLFIPIDTKPRGFRDHLLQWLGV